jgi:hypothetical protein
LEEGKEHRYHAADVERLKREQAERAPGRLAAICI